MLTGELNMINHLTKDCRHQISSRLTKSMKLSPSFKTSSFSASLDVPSTLWNLTVHCCADKILPPLSPIQSQMNQLHILFLYDPLQYYPPAYAWEIGIWIGELTSH